MMINKKLFLLLIGFATLFVTTSCDKDDEDIFGNWVEKSQFGGDKRAQAVSFVIDNKLYFGLGYNGTRSSGGQYFTDFYSFEGGTTWTDLAAFPGAQREGAFSFAVDGKGYVGCGYYNDTTEMFHSDVWEYNPAADIWTKIADFPGGKTTESTSFVVGGKAYVVGGRYDSDRTKSDCYEFDSSTKTFTKVASMRFKRYGAFAFVIGDFAYVGGGIDNSFVTSFERFDSKTKEWSENGELRDIYLLKDITEDIEHYDSEVLDIRRSYASTFSLNGKGYVIAGNKGDYLSDCWEYDPATDLWTEKNRFEQKMMPRCKATSFVLNGLPYIMAGQSGSGYLDDIWSFEPDAEADSND